MIKKMQWRTIHRLSLSIVLGTQCLGWFAWAVANPAIAQAQTVLLVTNTNDAGANSLRQAILDANAAPGPAVIRFAISAVSAGDAFTIALNTELPTINDVVTIDATTQAGYADTPLILLDGTATRGASGLVFGGPLTATAGSIVRGLAIGNFENIGINLSGAGPYIVQDNAIGVDLTGGRAIPNRLRGIYLAGSGSTIQNNIIVGDVGQTALFVAGNANLISGNKVGSDRSGAHELGGTAFGILLGGTHNRLQNNIVLGNFSGVYVQEPATDTVIENNLITFNRGSGIVLNGSHNQIFTNTIAFNGLAGISLQAGRANAMRANAIYSNTALGIDIDPAGQPNPNDTPGDADTGPNQSQNFPVIVSAAPITNGLVLDLALDSAANQRYSIDVFASDVCNGGTVAGRFGGDFGEGQRFLGTFDVQTNATGTVGTSLRLTTTASVPVGAYLSATATDANGNTSEFSPCLRMTQTRLLALFAFAFDNQPAAAGDLAPYYPTIERRITELSRGHADRIAVLLRDFGGATDNTRIVIVRDGVTMTLSGLPNPAGTLSDRLNEYDMADGATLGGFLGWARDMHPSDKTYFEIQGHGTALAPSTNYAALFAPRSVLQARLADEAIPLPRWSDMKDGFTDARSRSLFNVPALAQALRAGVANRTPFDVVNLSHCFAATIEELYEVAPFATALVASPNYDYLLTEAPAQIFSEMKVDATAQQMAGSVVQQLYTALPGWMHPGIFIAADSAQVRAVKPIWDAVSAAALAALDADLPSAKAHLLAAYRRSAKYDTTQCEPDWALHAPDALVDMGTFAQQLAQEFGAASALGRAAMSTTLQLSATVLAQQHRDSPPWFAGVPTATLIASWVFTGTGISLYADLEGMSNAIGTSGTALNWQAHWYTYTVSADNPSPYQFVLPQQAAATWADVVRRYWQDTPVSTVACLSRLTPQLRRVNLPVVIR